MAKVKVDTYNQDKLLESALKNKLPEFGKDREVVESFLDQLRVEGLGSARLHKYLYTLNLLRRLNQNDLATMDEGGC